MSTSSEAVLHRLVRPGRGPVPPRLVLLHGIGSNEADLFAVAELLDPELEVVCLRAPHEYGQGGYAWFDVAWTENGKQIDEAQVRSSGDQLLSDVSLRESSGGVIVGGFSQGAIMALAVLLRAPSALAGCLVMSGAPVPQSALPATPHSVGAVPVLVQHGVFDEVLPVELGRQAAEQVTAHGGSPDFREYPMAHQVSQQSLSDAISWVGAIIHKSSK